MCLQEFCENEPMPYSVLCKTCWIACGGSPMEILTLEEKQEVIENDECAEAG